MAAITTDNTNIPQFKAIPQEGQARDMKVAASTTIYRWSLVGLNATGYLVSYVPWAQALTPTGTPLVGIALNSVDNSSGSDGDKTCRVQTEGYFEYPLSAAAQLDIGKGVYAIDNATLTKIALNNELVGTIINIPATGVVSVELASPTVRAGIANGMMVKSRLVDFTNVVNDEVYLVHETENHNGLYLMKCWAVITEAIAHVDAAGVATIVHTLGTDTTLGCTLTCVDNDPVSDLIQGSGGQCDAGATGIAIVPVPADKAAIVKVTTVGAEAAGATGQANVFAKFAVL